MTQRQIDLWLNEESEKELMKRQCLKEKLMPHELAQAVCFFIRTIIWMYQSILCS